MLANETAQALFADNITEFGDSINSLRGDAVSFPLKSSSPRVVLLPRKGFASASDFILSRCYLPITLGRSTILTIKLQLGTQVENGKAMYIEDTLSTPPIPQINTLAVVHGCNQMVWQWEFIGIGPQFRVRGMTLITVDQDNKVAEQYVEFNSLAWAIDIGFNVTPPTTGPFAPPSSR
jgi:hypothetical protein